MRAVELVLQPWPKICNTKIIKREGRKQRQSVSVSSPYCQHPPFAAFEVGGRDVNHIQQSVR